MPKQDSISHDTDEQHRYLLRQMARGDESALVQLYHLLFGSIYAFALRRLEHTHDSQSVAVETMHEVWKNSATFSGQSKVKTWALGIARYKILDVLRQRGAQQMDDVDLYGETLADQAPTPFEQLVKSQRIEWVAFCMSKLPPVQRESLHLLFYEGMSMVEIGALHNCSDNTVKTRVFHAKKRIKDCLARWLKECDKGDV